MKEIILTSRQRMLASDQLAYELGLIPTAQEIDRQKKIILIAIGALALVTSVLIGYQAYQIHNNYVMKRKL